MPRKHDSKGRSTNTGRFLALPHFLMETPAWRTLNAYGRAAYIEVAALYRGDNNGYLDMGVRRLADRMGVGKNTAHKALKALVERGLIEPAQVSGFSRKDRQSTSWRLTHLRCDRSHHPGSRAYLKWRPAADETKTTVPHRDRTVPLRGTVVPLRSLQGGLS